ncbi:MAG: metallophosphoesterase [Prevotella sp.]|jgi:alkaline phosphatase|nr:metallophosphoesterase [Prevotella sp.]
MDRRQFLITSAGIAIFLVSNPLSAVSAMGSKKTKIKFGIVTDLHFSRRKEYGNRFFTHSLDKLKEAIKVFNRRNLDFIIELGDFKDQSEKPDRPETLSYLDEIEEIFQTFDGATYHVLGNHDMDSISKADFLSHTKNSGSAKGKACYTFRKKGIKFIVLDANYSEDMTDYNAGNFDWEKAFIPDGEKEWLEKELNCKYPVVVFTHQLLDSFSDVPKNVCIGNADEIREILERKNNVLAVFQGHHHRGHYSFRNGIHYCTLQALIEGAYPPNNSFAVVEIDRSLNMQIEGFNNCESRLLDKNSAQSTQINEI